MKLITGMIDGLSVSDTKYDYLHHETCMARVLHINEGPVSAAGLKIRCRQRDVKTLKAKSRYDTSSPTSLKHFFHYILYLVKLGYRYWLFNIKLWGGVLWYSIFRFPVLAYSAPQ